MQAFLRPDGTAATVYALATGLNVTTAGSFGVGQPIDCGVTYTAPGPFQLNVNVREIQSVNG